jgi:hypothetical protein
MAAADDSQINIRTEQSHGSFEDGLLELSNRLLVNVSLKACISCGYSDDHPGGSSPFGYLGCFRSTKESYRAVRFKGDLFKIWDKLSSAVQEAHLCPEFIQRIPGQGYRG